jgi:hypothetical protein
MIILKLDFEKAFDKVEHEVIMQVIQHMGFGPMWRLMWMKMIMGTGTSSILLNATPGKVFYYRRGVRQGDRLSSLLFVLAAETYYKVLLTLQCTEVSFLDPY